MKRFLIVFSIIIIFLSFGDFASAEELEIQESVKKYAGLEDIYSSLPDSVSRDEIKELEESAFSPNRAFEAITSKVLSLGVSSLKESISFFLGLCGFIILSGIINSIKESFANSTFHSAFEYVSILCLSVYVYSYLGRAFEDAAFYIRQINSFMLMMLPSMTALYALGGAAAQAMAQNASLLMTINILESVCADFLLPLLRICFAFSLVGSLSDINIGGVNKFMRRLITIICVLMLTILCGILFFQNSLAAAADSMSMRGIRFAAGTFIPIIGSLVGEAAKTVGGSISFIKNTTGIFVIVVVLYISLVPICRLVVKKLFLGLCTMVAEILGIKKEKDFLTETGELLNILLALMISTSIYFILALTVFIKSSVNI